MGRIREGYCQVISPFDSRRVTRVGLEPREVAAIVFWTRDPSGLLPGLQELDERGYRYLFLYTLLDYPPPLEPNAPPLRLRLETFKRLSRRLGSERVIWRYDPIILSARTDARFHLEAFDRLAAELEGATRRAVVSIFDEYAKIRARLGALEADGFAVFRPQEAAPQFEELMRGLARSAARRGMEIFSCAEDHDLKPYGIEPGSCIDGALLERLFNIRPSGRKDPGQRKHCRCAPSKDIGAYDTCLSGCLYCYATGSPARVRKNIRSLDPSSPSLLPAAPKTSASSPPLFSAPPC